jgi:hypothetical protein
MKRRRKRGGPRRSRLRRIYGRASSAPVLYRPMAPALDGHPACGNLRDMLGVRPRIDVRPRADGTVGPDGRGMSVNADPQRLPPSIRPQRRGGTGKLPLYKIGPPALGAALALEPPMPSAHAVVQPAREMYIDDFQDSLCATRGAWGKS